MGEVVAEVKHLPRVLHAERHAWPSGGPGRRSPRQRHAGVATGRQPHSIVGRDPPGLPARKQQLPCLGVLMRASGGAGHAQGEDRPGVETLEESGYGLRAQRSGNLRLQGVGTVRQEEVPLRGVAAEVLLHRQDLLRPEVVEVAVVGLDTAGPKGLHEASPRPSVHCCAPRRAHEQRRPAPQPLPEVGRREATAVNARDVAAAVAVAGEEVLNGPQPLPQRGGARGRGDRAVRRGHGRREPHGGGAPSRAG
mmetsp:Transcript_16092/g.50566  ORF Transcript_16092/g.50566 Transcript_16092/m.50566 type:complete len:251 (-) Transcript_16092:16-768(-)